MTALPLRVPDRARDVRTAVLVGQLRRRLRAAPPSAPQSEDLSAMSAEHAVVIAPHPDDEAIGCGGLIHHLRSGGTRVSVVFVTREGGASIVTPPAGECGEPKRKREARAAAAVLGIGHVEFMDVDELAAGRSAEEERALSRRLARLLPSLNPDLLLVPQFHEMHPDHRAVCTAALRAVMRAGTAGCLRLRRVLLYEVWGACRANAFLALGDAALRTQAEALDCYRSQLETVDYHAVTRLRLEERGREYAPGCLAEAYESLDVRQDVVRYLQSVQNISQPCC